MPPVSSPLSCLLCLAAGIAAAALLPGCSRNPFDDDKAGKDDDKEDSSFVLAQNMLKGTAQGASDLHQEAAADERTKERMGAAEEKPVKARTEVKSIGAPQGDPVLSKGSRPRSVAAGALLKSASDPARAGLALAKAAAGDTADLVLGDSAKGWIYSLRVFAFSDTAGGGPARAGSGRDSTRYRWPHQPANPALLSFDRRRTFDDGTVEVSSASDYDGDGLLSEAPAGKTIRLRRVWTVARGDSLWKTVSLTDHGQTRQYDSLGAGEPLSWTDSAFAAGKSAWWRRVYDADGDGFIATAAAGSRARIGSDSYADLGGGLFRIGYEIHGPGPDGDYARDADNERYASSSLVVNAQGEDVIRGQSGDADGDGLLWSAAAGAVNRIWETSARSGGGDLESYRDSVVKLLGPAREADARVIHYSAVSVRADGTRTDITLASRDGSSPFGPADTVLAAEKTFHLPGDPERRDSTVRAAQLVPGRLDTDADDLLAGWTVKVHYNAASPLSLYQETFVAAAPVAPGAEAMAGSVVVEERFRGAGPRDLAGVRKRRDFDRGAGTSEWKEVRTTGDGDSTVTQGGRAADGGSYASHAGKGFRSSGWYDPATGGIRDTTTWVDAKGGEAGRAVSEGVSKDGTGEVRRVITRADGRRAEISVARSRGADGALRLIRVAGADTARCEMRGDSVFEERAYGKVKVAFVLARLGAGAWTLDLLGKDAAGAKAIEGGVDFLPDGSGTGELVEYAAGMAKPAVSFRSDPDGAVRLDGKPLP